MYMYALKQSIVTTIRVNKFSHYFHVDNPAPIIPNTWDISLVKTDYI